MSGEQQMRPGQPARKRWPRWARRGLLENVAIGLIALGVLMLVLSASITLYRCPFVTVLAGTVMFTIVRQLAE